MNRRNRNKKEANPFDVFQEKIAKLELGAVKSFWQNLPKLHQRGLMILIPIVTILLILPTPNDQTTQTIEVATNNEATRTEVTVNTTSLSEEGETKQTVTKTDDWQEYTVQSGDTLAKVFRANSLSMADLNALVAVEGLDKPLSKIKKGQLVRFKLAAEGHLDILQLEKSGSSVMFFRLSDGGYGRSK